MYLPYLEERGLRVITRSFITRDFYTLYHKKGHLLQKGFGVLYGFVRKFFQLYYLFSADFVLVQREATPIGPPVFEWIYARVFRKKMIYDFDDAIWIPNTSEANKIANSLKCTWKIKYLIKWSHTVIAGNHFLYEYATQYNKNVRLIPTCVDLKNRYHLRADQEVPKITIGWTGSFSTMSYLDLVIPVLKRLEKEFEFTFFIMSNRAPEFSLKNQIYKEWSEELEVSALRNCQIGIMPLTRDTWTLGKCGFKIIQYMALGIVPVADAWGANKDIISNGEDGFLVENESAWEASLRRLLEDQVLRKQLAERAVRKIEAKYSLEANLETFVQVFNG